MAAAGVQTSRSPPAIPRGRMVAVDGLGSAYWVLIQCLRPRPPGDLVGCAPACDHDLDLLGELLDLARLVEKPLLGHAQEDDDRGDDRAGDVGDGADRAVGAEVGDPPAAAVQGDPEHQQAELMLLSGYAGQDGELTR